jgi:hypothetical protein
MNWNQDIKLLFGDDIKETLGGGVYLKLATGYEFNSGLILELSWTYITSSAKYKLTRDSSSGKEDVTQERNINLTFRKIGLSAGYKFSFQKKKKARMRRVVTRQQRQRVRR